MTTLDKTNKILEIAELASKLGWVIALPDSDAISHMVIGTPEAVKLVCAQIETEDYDIMRKEELQ